MLIIALIAIYVLWSRAAQAAQPISTSISEATARPRGWKLHVVSGRSGGPDGVRLFDVNGDGLQDVVSAFESSGDILVSLHPGLKDLDGGWPSVVVGNEPRGEDAFAIDINGDGNVDILSSHEGDTLGLFVHWAPSKPEDYLNPDLWMSERIEVADGHGWMFAVAMDVNEDGQVDIVAGSKDDFFNDRNSVGELAWLETPTEDRDEWLYHPIDHVGWPMSIEAIDLDQDGDLDILVSDRNADEEHQGLRWLENPGENWTEEWTSHFVAGLEGARPMFLGLGDLDGDGMQDLAVPIDVENEIVLVSLAAVSSISSSGGAITLRSDLDSGEAIFKAAGIADIDMDGVSEIILSTDRGNVGIGYFDQTAGSIQNAWTWIPIFDALVNPKFDLIAFDDVDADGDLDFFTTEERQGLGIVWFENPAINPK